MLFERLLALQNDLGLLAEEYDPRARRVLGNFPQAFSQVGQINTAINLASVEGSAAMSLQAKRGVEESMGLHACITEPAADKALRGD